MKLAAEKDAQNSCLFDCARLRGSTVALIGAGGLGCPLAVHLAAAGVGKTVIIDFDTVSASNLNRQFLYTEEDTGKPKAQLAADFLSRFAPDCGFVALNERLDDSNARSLLDGCCLVVTACDNVKTRLTAAKACAKLRIPLLDCGISGGCGMVFLYIPGKTACPGCIMAAANESADKRTCSAAAGAVSSAAAMTALQFLSSGKSDNAGKMIILDTLNNTTDILPVKRTGECIICGGDNNG